MIIIGKFVRGSKIVRQKQIERGYHNRNIQLFDPVYGINRDHCWMEGAKRKYLKQGWYIIRGKRQRYIDSNGYEKSSIIPKGKIFLFS